MAFMQDIFAGRKQFLTREMTRDINFPQTPECSVAKLWPIVQQNARLQSYMPKEWTSTKKVDRNFLITVMSTLYYDFMVAFAADVRAQRQKLREQKAQKHHEIEITDEWLQLLASVPYKSSKSLC